MSTSARAPTIPSFSLYTAGPCKCCRSCCCRSIVLCPFEHGLPCANVTKPAGLVTAFLHVGKEACRQAAAVGAGAL